MLNTLGDLVLAVERRYTLDEEDMRVRLEGDRVRAIGKDLPKRLSHGEFTGVSLLRPRAAACTWMCATPGMERAHPRYYEDVYADDADASDVRSAPSQEGEYAEVDTPEDVPVATGVIERHTRAYGVRRPALNRPRSRGVPSGLHLRTTPTTKTQAAEELARRSRISGSNAVRPRFGHGERLTKTIERRAGRRNAGSGSRPEVGAGLGSRAHRVGRRCDRRDRRRTLPRYRRSWPRRGPGYVIVAPTQLSHDGICSPVAVVPDETGRTESLGAVAPTSRLHLDADAHGRSGCDRSQPASATFSPTLSPCGLGAGGRARSRRDRPASVGPVGRIVRVDRTAISIADPATLAKDPTFLRPRRCARAIGHGDDPVAGTSRPASGGEHEISHAIDALFGGRALHGAQVAFGCIVSVALYGDDTRASDRARDVGSCPRTRRTWDLMPTKSCECPAAAPETRPGRFTILEEADLDEARRAQLVARIWPA